jgi:hypothetical protein
VRLEEDYRDNLRHDTATTEIQMEEGTHYTAASEVELLANGDDNQIDEKVVI